MKIAVIGDVHGNLPVLKASLETINSEKCDLIVCTGDVIGIGPFPRECLEFVLQHNVLCLMGNHEELFIEGLENFTGYKMSEGEREHQRWIHNQLDDDLKKVVASFPYTHTERYGVSTVSFLHYARDEGNKGFKNIVKKPQIEELETLFGNVNSDIVIFGHCHDSLDLTGNKRYINPGSLGCNAGKAVARFIIIETGSDVIEACKYSVPYEDKELFVELENRKVPDRELIKDIFFKRN